MKNDQMIIDSIRASSRSLVRLFGFMEGKVVGSDLSASMVHTLIEIERHELTATQLAKLLRLEKSSVSRLLTKLKSFELIREKASTVDARQKILVLTEDGRAKLKKVHQHANQQVSSAIDQLSQPDQKAIVDGLQLYSDALSDSANTGLSSKVDIVVGYSPGVIGAVTSLHTDFYANEKGFGLTFETRVADGLSDFCNRLDDSQNQIWTARVNQEIVGSIAIDGQNLGSNNCHLRWFIVDGRFSGQGVGRELLTRALRFVDQHKFTETYLSTVDGLPSAHHLYTSQGFVLAEERLGQQWGSEQLEQLFVRKAVL